MSKCMQTHTQAIQKHLRDVAEPVVHNHLLQIDIGRAAVALQIEVRLRNQLVLTFVHRVRTNRFAELAQTKNGNKRIS